MLEKPKIGNVNNNNRTLSVGPFLSCKTYFKLNFFSRIPDRVINLISISPPAQYSDSKNNEGNSRRN